MKPRILVVDDEPGIREALRQVLEYEGYEVKTASTGPEGISAYPEFRPHLVFLDVKMAGLDGLETLSRLKEVDSRAQIVMISGHGTIATAVAATQRGAFDFLEKPLDTDRLLVTVRNALAQAELKGENARLREAVESRHAMVGNSRALKEVQETIDKVGPTPARVLITGENGTGKELVARAIHDRSPRKGQPFIEVNCAAIPSELIESELFGHMKGSFTGAFADRAGKFEQADEGTLFLDEVGDMSLAAQAKVLRVLQEGIVTRIGGSKPIQVPPLRERREDIPALVHHFAETLSRFSGMPAKRFDEGAVRRLQQHSWPGNVRELRNAVERAMILAPGRTVMATDLERMLGESTLEVPEEGLSMDRFVGATFEGFKHEAEKSFLEAKLKEYDWNVSETARALKMPRSNLYKKIERYGLTREGS
jgi:two-component system nitrogen regulation response regulator NtrX